MTWCAALSVPPCWSTPSDFDQCFPAVDYFEGKGIPFVVCVNCFDGVARHKLEDVREALGVPADVPMMYTDARERAATKQALIAVVQLAMKRLKS